MPRVQKNKPCPLPLSPLPVGTRIATVRKSKGITQTDLAKQLGLSQKQITNYETGKVHLNDEMIVRFSLALAISADELLGIKDITLQQCKPRLRFTSRFRDLEQLPIAKQKIILNVLDDLIRANN